MASDKNKNTTPMGMFLQDPSLPALLGDYEFPRDKDFHEGMGSSRLVVRDEDEWGNPVGPALEWRLHQDLSVSFFAKHARVVPEMTVAGKTVRLPNNLEIDPAVLIDNPQFRQVNLFAVAAHTLQWIEEELGHNVQWGSGEPLILRPHAFEGDDAYYDPNDCSLNFGYQRGGEFPHHMVWNCLSHDTIAHELGHAVLTGLRPRFGSGSWLDSNAIHESFADLIAIFSALEHEEVIDRMETQTGGDLLFPNLVTELFEREGLLNPHLRSALDWPPYKPDKPKEPHDRGVFWTGAMWETLVRVEKEVRQRNPGATLAQCVTTAVRWLKGILLRTLAYLPPTGMTMPSWAALIWRADELVFPSDDALRKIAMDVFRESGFFEPAKYNPYAFDPPGHHVGAALKTAHETGDQALALTIMEHAEQLRIPTGHGISLLTPNLVTTRRNVDRETTPAGSKTIHLTQQCLHYGYRLPGGLCFGGVLVMKEDWTPQLLVTDPPQTYVGDPTAGFTAITSLDSALAEWRHRARSRNRKRGVRRKGTDHTP